MNSILLFALSLSGMSSQSEVPQAQQQPQPLVVEDCDAIRRARVTNNMSVAQRNAMLDEIHACHERVEVARKAEQAANPQKQGVALWD